MLLIYVDIILLFVLVTLTMFTFCFCIYHMNRLHKGGRVTILVDRSYMLATKHPSMQPLHTVVSYGPAPPAPARAASDSGLSAAYEPLDAPPAAPHMHSWRCTSAPPGPACSPSQYNRITRTWDWHYKEYQI